MPHTWAMSRTNGVKLIRFHAMPGLRVAAVFVLCSLGCAQFSPDEEAYERYRYWATQVPAAEQHSPDLLDRYRQHLKDEGLTDTDIDAQVRTIRVRGKRLEAERWNRILTADKPRFNTQPNAFLVDMAKTRKPGTALDVGMGQGRNAIWLAQQGWAVTGFDPAERAVALAQKHAAETGVKLTTEVKDDETFDFGENRYDLIVMSYVDVRAVARKAERALKPGGIVVVEAAHRDATKGHSIGGAVVWDTGELPSLFRNLRVVRYEEPMAISDFGLVRSRVVRLCAEKPVE